MATKVIMPALGMAQETGIVVSWLKREGDQVTAGEPLMEVETDKTVAELEAPASGILAGVTAREGDEVPVAETIAWILAPGEALPAAAPAAAPTEKILATPEASPVATRMAADHGLSLAEIPSNGRRITKADVQAYLAGRDSQLDSREGSRLPASPLARRLAGEADLDLAEIHGSGPAGAVLAGDVRAFLAQAAAPAPAAPGGKPPAMSRAWRTMAGRLAEAWRTIPHFYLEREIDAGTLQGWRAEAQTGSETKITVTDLLLRATAAALRRHPRLNAAWIEDEIQFNEAIHIGLAVAVEDGLVVPVIPFTDRLSVAEIAAAREGIVSRALAGKLKAADLQGGTMTLSNLGMFGVDRFSAIVNPPQAAILAAGKIADRVVPLNGEIAIQPRLTLTLSCDHRVVDGARGAAFLETLAAFLEQPLRLL